MAQAPAAKPAEAMLGFENNPLWKLKVRLQFSGWLQYIAHAMVIVALLLLAGLGWLTGVWPWLLVDVPLGLAAFLTVALVGTVVMVKYGLHPAEPLPKPKTHLGAFDLMRARHSCRSFQSRNLTDAHREALMEEVRFATRPDALLGSRPIRFEYIAAPLTVWPVVGAHEFLIAVAPREYDRMAVIDVGRSLQKVVLKATRMGLATCWIGPGADQKSIVRHMGERFDPTADHVICVCAIGYESWFKPLMIRAMRPIQHRRKPLSELFFADPGFSRLLDTQAAPFADFGRCYEVCRWSPSSYNSQTTRCTAVVEAGRLVRFDFGAATASRFYAAVALGIWLANWEAGCVALGKAGRFAVLSAEERAVEGAPVLPRYDVSWIIGAPAAA